MPSFSTTLRAAATALAGALIIAPAAHASSYGPAMSAAEIRALQAQGVREIIVKRAPGVSAAQQATIRAQAGVTYAGPGPLPNTELDRAPAGQLSSAVAGLERESAVQYAEPNGTVHAASAPNDAYFSQQWALLNSGQSLNGTSGTAGDDIGATYVWPHSTGSGVSVAVVDTGVDFSAPDLQGQLAPGFSWVNGDTNPQDQNGHGTHVSGIIAAAQNNGIGVSGVAPGARVMPLQALDGTGSGSDANVAAAFAYAGQHGIRIVNASLGGSAPSQTIEQAIADYPDTLYVVAAGNGGTDNDSPTTPFYPCDLTEPNVICVGASDQNDQPAYFSNYGAGSVDLFAPGVNILSTWIADSSGNPRYAYADGTSMSTPVVTGTLALMLARNPSLSAAQLKSDLLASADQEPQFAGESLSGGVLDAAAAVATAGGDPPYAPPGNRARPVLSGSAAVGSTLSVSTGTWSRGPTGYAYRWERCWSAICLPVPGATSASYTIGPADAGTSFYAVVTAASASGSTQAISIETDAVPGGRSPASPGPAASTSRGSSTASGRPGGQASVTRSAARLHRVPIRLTRVALRGRGSAVRGRILVFRLSARIKVHVKIGSLARLTLPGRHGANRYSLGSLLRGRRLRRGRYRLTVSAGGRTVRLWLRVA